ncbi:MAG: 3-deoxy-7-phosphoheptulonate synthase, partial [Proteobacteria bacterium]|nr:3-deoxy-7-phosphoheptulonate synthase [Pseudomonadota bacterium]
ILRGGNRPNYDRESINEAAESLESVGLAPGIMIDCSHANSQKQFQKQLGVCRDIMHQLKTGQKNIFGVMIESHLLEGRQDIEEGSTLTYGQSITDACIGWDDSKMLLTELADAVREKRKL